MTEPLMYHSTDQDSEPSQPVQNSNNEDESVAATEVSGRISPQPISDEEEKSKWELPIALRKGIRECRNHPLYPTSNYVPYEGLSSDFTHQILLFHC